ncbi:carbon-nitrogen hydrolase [Candidatus Endoriftia persephone]|jgi:N-carbamoylputrescine amidase|uniref:N-carbamoylputrescine amidase n=3 Tax=Gammaproteobacteria TaxID=1236 RepID=G2FFE3_9GAMM|nr:carbon-nitrogen hydrolase [Candidatus Endoriftia persephone]EGV52149.1 N-carbamoylputrescine amidase [endosymbiont of Riftia pachyptila (vent Ph05)]EGW54521.1 N-carbamoylputrescine amidase [endosymbiont of Tevnia jerichonana (vent Tica)]USF88959.1 carbon-nitrogen hydrolase [Candidatus Endoriftia persephone]
MLQKSLSIGLVQQKDYGSREQNLENCIQGVREACGRGARLILLQELHNSRYFCQHEDPELFDLAEPVPGPTTEQLAVLAAELEVVIVASLFERRAAGLYHNTAVVLESDGTLAGIYRKKHIPDDPGFYEKFYFAPGDGPFSPIQTSIGRLGVLICWDQWFPEAARLMALSGAEILLYPTAIGWDPGDGAAEQQRQFDAWQTVQRGHAIANGLPLVACNRTGFETDPSGVTSGIQFWGGSFICGPQGEMLAQAKQNETQVVLAKIDLQHSEKVRRIWPFLRDRRIDSYAPLLQLFNDPQNS